MTKLFLGLSLAILFLVVYLLASRSMTKGAKKEARVSLPETDRDQAVKAYLKENLQPPEICKIQGEDILFVEPSEEEVHPAMKAALYKYTASAAMSFGVTAYANWDGKKVRVSLMGSPRDQKEEAFKDLDKLVEESLHVYDTDGNCIGKGITWERS